MPPMGPKGPKGMKGGPKSKDPIKTLKRLLAFIMKRYKYRYMIVMVCIARALLKKPKILILDDSTSAVDTATDAKIRTAFREEIPNTTKLIIAQRISSVEDADHIIVLNEGQIDGYGTHEELLKNNEIYRDIYELQKKGADE